jgi:argininosuccinate lyase
MSNDPLANKAQAWSALFSEPMSELVQRYTASVGFDQRLWQADIAGSLAHAEMLAAQGIIGAQDLADIRAAWRRSRAEIEAGRFEWKLELEDVHLNIEARLTALVGDAGKRLHTGRSRNDQVATDVRLWLRGEIDGWPRCWPTCSARWWSWPRHTETVMPGFTHLQVAQPVSFAHHLLAYVEMFARDAERLADVRRAPTAAAGRRRAGRHQLPAGPRARGAHAGLRRRVPEQPGRRQRPRLRARVQRLRSHLHGARVAPGRGDRAVDEPELRLHRPGRPLLHRLVHHAAEAQPRRRRTGARQERPRGRPPDGLLTLMKGQPLTYNKDNQEDKEPLFDTVDTLRDTLRIMAEMVGGIVVKAEAMERAALRGYATATDLADYLVKKGLPFRDAHETVAHAVKVAIGRAWTCRRCRWPSCRR